MHGYDNLAGVDEFAFSRGNHYHAHKDMDAAAAEAEKVRAELREQGLSHGSIYEAAKY